MPKKTRRLAAPLVAAIATAALAAGPASADPVNSRTLPITIDCGEAGTYQAVANGNGQFTPAHDVNSTSVLIPVAFGPATFTLTDADGNIVDQETDPGDAKGSASPAGRTLVDCSYTFSGSQDGYTFSGTGTVTGFISGNKA